MNIREYRSLLLASYETWLQTPGGKYARSIGMAINGHRYCHDLLNWVEWLEPTKTDVDSGIYTLQTALYLQERYNAGGSVVWYSADKPGVEDNDAYFFQCRCPGLFDFEGDTAYIAAIMTGPTPAFKFSCFSDVHDSIPEHARMADVLYDTLDEAASVLLATLITHGALNEGE